MPVYYNDGLDDPVQYDRQASFSGAYGAYDLLQEIYNLSGKPTPGKFKNGVDKGDKYFTSDGMARGGVR